MSVFKSFNQPELRSSTIAVTAAGITVGYLTLRIIGGTLRNYSEKRKFAALRRRKQLERQKQFEELRSKFTFGSNAEAITALDYQDLVHKLQTRELKAKQVLEAYVAKSLVVTDEFNCVTEFIPQCFEWADHLDKLPAVKGPLHGVPFCVKDDHHIPGMDSTLGCSRYLYKPDSDTAVIVQVLQDAGAVPFCKTNLPQTTFSGSSENPIFGLTLNPLNKGMSPGGSSSGTGCVVSAGGAPFGIGSDIGGSIRIPAHFCGVCGLRPTIRRNSSKGVTGCITGNAGFSCVSGILAPTATAMAKIHQVLWSDAAQYSYDANVVPISWNASVFTSKRPLRIGYFTSVPVIPAVGDAVDTVLKAKKALESLGHSLVEFDSPDAPRIFHTYLTLLLADGLKQINDLLQNDAISPTVAGLTKRWWMPSFLENILTRLLSALVDEDMRSWIPDASAQKSQVLWDYLAKAQKLRDDLFQRWRDQELDLLLSPAFPIPAPILKDTDELMWRCTLYSTIWNLMDCPAGIVPFGRESGGNFMSSEPTDRFLRVAQKTVRAAEGMPIGVQLVGLPFQEETVLRAMRELEAFVEQT